MSVNETGLAKKRVAHLTALKRIQFDVKLFYKLMYTKISWQLI